MNVTNLVLGIVVLGLLIWRQLVARPVRDGYRVPLILGIIGVVELISFLNGKHVNGTLVAGLAGSLVLAAVFGAARAMVSRVWIEDGRAWRRGGWVAAGLWVLALAAHLDYDQLVYKHSALGEVTILLYLAISLLVQGVILQARAQRLPEAQDRFLREPVGPR
jgi:hypothetical protein